MEAVNSRGVGPMMDKYSFDPLEHFLMWWMQSGKPILPPKDSAIINDDGRVIETILYRSGQFQVQMCVVLEGSELPDHIHPEVDSFEVYISGDITFRCNGESFTPAISCDDILRIHPSSVHGGSFGKSGGVFLSVQYWLDGVHPDFISKNWAFADNDETERNKKG